MRVEPLADLLDAVEDRAPLAGPGKSGALLERVVVDGEPRVLKHLDAEGDWTIRASRVDLVVPVELARRGILAALPACLRQPILRVAQAPPSPGLGRAALLMEDVGDWVVPADDSLLTEAANERFLDHMAQLHAHFWDSTLALDVVPAGHRYAELSPAMATAEEVRGAPDLVPRLVAQGWPLLAQVAPRAAEVVVPLAHDPGPLVAALAGTPQTFVHGNWKLDNLGTDLNGRTVVLDWELSGRGAATEDLAWYLAINCRRLPVSKEQAIEVYRTALERHGIDTGPWWDRQLGLTLLGGLVHFGWEKALGGYDDELAWWEERAVEGGLLL